MFPDIQVGDLFPAIMTHGRYLDQRGYVEQQMVDMADAGTLCLTELLSQQQRVYQMVGEVIMGHGYDAEGELTGRKGWSTGFVVPQELVDYQIEIVSISGEPIRYADGMTPIKSRSAGRGGRVRGKLQPQLRERIVEVKGELARVSLRQAWLILKERGAYCRLAEHPDDQDHWWKYLEIHELLAPAIEALSPKVGVKALADRKKRAIEA